MRPLRVQFTLLAIIPAIVWLSCDSGDDPVTPEPPPAPVWSEITDLPSSVTFFGLWGPRADFMIGVGRKGHIWQWDGQRFAQRASPTGEDLFGIAGSIAGSVVAVGDNGTLLEQSQGLFVPRDVPTAENLRGVWLSESGQFVVVGMNGTIMRGSGVNWTVDAVRTFASLFGVWGSSADDIFAVGVGGTILHYDGAEWTAMQSGTAEILAAVGGTSATDVYAVGGAGTILHYDGSSWTAMASGTSELLQAVCAGCGPAATGANGTVVRLVGGAWQRDTIPGAPWLYSMTSVGGEQWTAGAQCVFRYDGAGWSNETRGLVPILRDLTSSPVDGLVAAGENGIVMLDGPGQFRSEDAGAFSRLNAVWSSPDGELFAVGINHIVRRTESDWVIENQELIEYFDISGNNDVTFAVGAGGAIRRRVGTTWSKVTLVSEDLHAIHMTSSAGYAAGNNGYILYFDGSNWTIRFTRSGAVLWDIMAFDSGPWRAVAVGAAGLSLGRERSPTGVWTPLTTHVNVTLYALARGPGGDLYAAGASGTVLRMVDDQWTTIPSPTTRTFIGATSRGDALHLCGGNITSGGMIFRFGPPVN